MPNHDPRTADRQVLASFGVPDAWMTGLQGPDRFAALLDMVQFVPEVANVVDPRVVAVIGTPHAVQRESHRIAVDLQDGATPRPVLRLPIQPVPQQVLGQAAPQLMVAMPVMHGGASIVAIECPDGAEPGAAAAIAAVDADMVVVAVRATRPYGELMAALGDLRRPVAVAFDGPASLNDIMPFLASGMPVVRVDGIPLDRVSIAALLCGYLNSADLQEDSPEEPILPAALTAATTGDALAGVVHGGAPA